MKAILIDAKAREVREVEFAGGIGEIYRLLSNEEHQVDTFDVVRLEHNDAIYIDDNGLLHEPPKPYWFKWKGYPQPLCGNGLILGADNEGDETAPQISLEAARHAVEFLRYSDEIGALERDLGHGVTKAYRVPQPMMRLLGDEEKQ